MERESLTAARRSKQQELTWEDIVVLRDAGLDDLADRAMLYLPPPRNKMYWAMTIIVYGIAVWCLVVGLIFGLALMFAFWDWVL